MRVSCLVDREHISNTYRQTISMRTPFEALSGVLDQKRGSDYYTACIAVSRTRDYSCCVTAQCNRRRCPRSLDVIPIEVEIGTAITSGYEGEGI
jgi:hypothetical protein